ncbi:MAG: PAS domain S-box protein [Cyanobacteria bacterium]|nr:PAS domain S-box protein [Cyanobacteriota bacterium]MDW8200980.1 PAS domain S-box protein [Cyanobacteriota bacterium SKYGB_h_bin112]
METLAELKAQNEALQHQLRQTQAELQMAQAQLQSYTQQATVLHQTQCQLDNILASAIVCITHFRLYPDRRTEHYYCSPGSNTIFGYAPEQMLDACFWWSRIHPDDQGHILASNERLLTQPTAHHEYRFWHADGRWCWIAGTLTAHWNPEEHYWTVTAVDTDITDQKLAEAALREKIQRERLMRAVINHIRQFLDLEHIFQQTVTEVQRFLGCDRVLVYEFNLASESGYITYEAVVPGCRSLLGIEITDRGFSACVDDYLAGRIQNTPDIYQAPLPECYVAKQAELDVRANLVVPIIKRHPNGSRGELWGLLAAQYCNRPHQWQPYNVELLQDLASQLAIALQQAALYQAAQTTATELDGLLNATTACIFRMRVFRNGTRHKLYYSAACERLYGYSAAELLSDPLLWQSRVLPEDLGGVLAPLWARYFADCPPQVEFRFRHRDGSIRWISTSYRVECHVPNADPALDYKLINAVNIDVTARKLAELALQRSEAQTRAILAAIPDLMILVHRDGTYLSQIQASQSLVNLVNHIALPSPIGRNIVELLPPEIATQHMTCIQQALATGEVQHYEKEVVVAGRVQYEDVRFAPVDDETVLLIVRDIGDRKRAELALQQQMQREQALNAVIRAIHYSLDLETIFVTASREITNLLSVQRTSIVQYFPEQRCWRRITGYSHDGSIVPPSVVGIPDEGNPIAEQLKRGEIVPVDANHPIQDPINRALAKDLSPPWLIVPIVVNQTIWGNIAISDADREQWQPAEIELMQQVSEQLAIAIYQAQLYDQAQTANATLARLNQDLEALIADRTKALRQSEELFRSLFDKAPIGIALCDPEDRRLLQVNQKFCQLTGYSAEELATMAIADITHPDDRDQEYPLAAYCLATHQSNYRLEKRYITKQGTIRWVQVTVTLLYGPDGELQYSLGMTEDITLRKQTEEALRASEAQNRAILAAVPDLMVLYSAEGIYQGLIKPSNTLMSLLDLLPGPNMGKHLSELLPPEIAANQEAAIQRAMATKTVQTYEQVVTIGDRVQYEEVRVAPVDEHKVLLMVRDIGERKQAELKVRASLREKELLLQEIHHRVKNNLQIICSLLNLQANTFQDPHIIEPLMESQRRVRTMALVHERLYQTASLAELDIADYITELVSDFFLASLVDNVSINLRFNLVHLNLEADMAIACGLIINELVSNALKYAFPNDRPGEVYIGFQPHPSQPDYYTLTIADDGIGLPADFDVHNTTSLGLQIVCALVSQLFGTLEVDRAPGTAFRITFPIHPPK